MLSSDLIIVAYILEKCFVTIMVAFIGCLLKELQWINIYLFLRYVDGLSRSEVSYIRS